MNAKRINLIGCVLAGLADAGYSSVKVVSAVNSELGRLQVGKGGSEAKLGDGRLTKSEYKVTESLGSTAWHGKRSPGLEFDAWHSAIAKANKIGEMDKVPIPTVFTTWLQSMKSDAPKSEPKSEKSDAPSSAPLAPAELLAKVGVASK
jgi:hypothetical protein